MTYETANVNLYSDGRSDSIIQTCTLRGAINNGADASNCINIQDGFFNGWTGKITNIQPTFYEITFTQVGTGLAITGKWHGIIS